MNIFEDLVEELKEEKLLEETVIEVHKESLVTQMDESKSAQNSQASNFTDTGNGGAAPALPESASDSAAAADSPHLTGEDYDWGAESEAQPLPTDYKIAGESGFDEYQTGKKQTPVENTKKIVSEKEYFRKRAMDEVSGLQMVDHVLSAVEREQMKLAPKPYDDLPVKLALHDFLQVAHETNSTEHAQAEFRLMQETENWCSALSHRDKHVSIAHLRRHCETTRPPLSAQALISLARFYRNSPFSEPVRNKFELVMTRLFSREDESETRELILSREEMIQQVKELYADWSSIQLYSSAEDDSDILIAVLKFDDFINEAENTAGFDELIGSDFFNRLRMFKQNCNENFFAPLVTVASIEANIKIGNRYLELLHERGLNAKREAAEIVEVSVREQKRPRVREPKKPRSKLFAVNKWLLAATILTLLACAGLYFWAEQQGQDIKPSPRVEKVNLENTEFKEFIQTARIDNDTFFGVTTSAWEGLDSERKEEMLKKLQAVGTERNFQKVHLINSGGKAVGFSSAAKTEVYQQ